MIILDFTEEIPCIFKSTDLMKTRPLKTFFISWNCLLQLALRCFVSGAQQGTIAIDLASVNPYFSSRVPFYGRVLQITMPSVHYAISSSAVFKNIIPHPTSSSISLDHITCRIQPGF